MTIIHFIKKTIRYCPLKRLNNLFQRIRVIDKTPCSTPCSCALVKTLIEKMSEILKNIKTCAKKCKINVSVGAKLITKTLPVI